MGLLKCPGSVVVLERGLGEVCYLSAQEAEGGPLRGPPGP